MKVAVRQQSLCLLLEEGESRKSRGLWTNCRMCGCCFKTQFGNFTNGWISSENAFVAPTRKRETLPKWADLLENELFVVLEEGESFSTRAVCSPYGTTVRNCPGGGTPIHYIYGYVPPKGVVILKLLI